MRRYGMTPLLGVEVTEARQPGSTHLLTCPACGKTRYTDSRFMEQLVQAQAWLAAESPNSVEILGPACTPCYAVMEVRVLASGGGE
jgi:hypothetical protein